MLLLWATQKEKYRQNLFNLIGSWGICPLQIRALLK